MTRSDTPASTASANEVHNPSTGDGSNLSLDEVLALEAT